MQIMEHAQWIRNKAVLLTHFSSRYNIEVITYLHKTVCDNAMGKDSVSNTW